MLIFFMLQNWVDEFYKSYVPEPKRKVQERWLRKHLSEFAEAAPKLVDAHPNNIWVKTPTFEVYIRHNVGREGFVLDIAKIEVAEKYQGQGVFNALIEQAKQLSPPFTMLRLESIGNPILLDWCIRKGWSLERVKGGSFPPSYTLEL